MNYKPDTIVITGLGMVSGIGHDVVSSCAAARAGITRTCEVDTYTVFNEEEMEPENVVGHAIQSVTDGFEGIGRLVRMGMPALKDLISNCGITGIDLKKTGFWLSLPDFNRTLERLPEDGEESNEEEAEEEYLDEETEEEAIDPGTVVSRKLLELLELDIPLTQIPSESD